MKYQKVCFMDLKEDKIFGKQMTQQNNYKIN